MRVYSPAERMPIVVLISGGGTNLQALIDSANNESALFQIACVISNRPNVKGLQRAELAGIATLCIDHRDFAEREAFDEELIKAIDNYAPELVVLAGFMRILTTEFVQHYYGRMVNIHPSLLPKYRGLHTHQRALDAGDSKHGVSIHFVTEELDGGPIIIQSVVPVVENDTADTLAARVLKQEHLIYPLVVGWYAKNKLRCQQGQVFFDEKTLEHPLQYQELTDEQKSM